MRVVICDDHVMLAEALSGMLAGRGHEVLDVVHDAPQSVIAVLKHRPDICLLDLRLPSGSGLLVIPALRMASPDTRVEVLTALVDKATAAEAQRLGAAAFIGKDQPLDAIEAVFKAVMSHPPQTPWEQPVSKVALGGVLGRGSHRLRFLTERERQVLGALRRGLDTTEIARELGVERSTARTHIQNVLVKLGVHSRLEAAALVIADDPEVAQDPVRLMQQR
jgi:DNA-binding NarL/FixJ family response regulator